MTTLVLALLIVLSVPALLVIAGQVAEGLRSPMTATKQTRAPGRIVRLSEGRTHLRSDGPAEGPVIVFVHGLSTPSDVWEPLVERLSGKGYRLVRLDLYGRGYSDAPLREHRLELYARQVADLLDAERCAGPVLLVGFSMGGAVVTAFADLYPARCSGLVLIAPAGLKHGLKGLYHFCARWPVLGDAVWSLYAGRMLVRWTRNDATEGARFLPEVVAREAARRGWLPAQLSALRHGLSRSLDATHARLARRHLSVLALWGAQDEVIPLTSKDRLSVANPAAEQVVIADAGHGLPYTHPQDVAGALARWLYRVAPLRVEVADPGP